MTLSDRIGGRSFGRPFLLCVALALALAPIVPVSRAAAATQGYTITGFDTVRLDAPIRVEIMTGKGVSGGAEGDRALLDRIDMQVSGRQLRIALRPARPGELLGSATLHLSTQALIRVAVNGGGVLDIDRIKGQQVQLSLSGNGEMIVRDMDVERLNLLLGGNGRMTLAGRAGMVTAQMVGAGMIDAGKLTGRDVTVGNNGPGSVTVGAEGRAEVVSTGSGDTIIAGKTACKVQQRGSGHVSCGGEAY